MGTLNLDKARSIIEFALNWREENGLNPLTVAVLDSAGVLIALAREDGASNLRPEIAQGKARGAISMGIGSRALFNRAQEQPYFIQSMNSLANGFLVPVPGGVLIKSVMANFWGRLVLLATHRTRMKPAPLLRSKHQVLSLIRVNCAQR